MHAGGKVLKEGDVEVYAAPVQNVFNAHLPRPCPGQRVQDIFETTLRLGVKQPSGLGIIVGPSAPFQPWTTLLKELGIRCGYWVPFMVRDLTELIPRSPAVDGIRISRLEDFSLFQKHPHPYIGNPTTPHRQAEISYTGMLAQQGRAEQFMAWKGDIPVGAATVFFHRGTAAVYNVGVLPAYRNRGIGENLMRRSLHAARKKGMACATLSAASKAIPVYERVGFISAGHYGSYYIGRARLEQMVRDLDSQKA